MKTIIKYIFLCTVISLSSLHAQPLTGNLFVADSRSEFYRILDAYPLAVVNFVDYDRTKDKPRDVERMQKVFADVADDAPFNNTVAFVGVNLNLEELSKLKDDIKSLKDAMQGQSTIVMLFFKGESVVKEKAINGEKKASIAIKKGYINEQDLELFVNKYFGETIDQLLEQMEGAEPEYAEQPVQYRYVQQPAVRYVQRPVTYYYPRTYRRAYYDYYDRPYWGGYYRPWGWGYRRPFFGGFGPGFGLGFGFGRGGFGIGFGW